jgi:hypothetical protein
MSGCFHLRLDLSVFGSATNDVAVTIFAPQRCVSTTGGGIDAEDLMDFFEQAMGGGMSRGPGKDVQVGPHFSRLLCVSYFGQL